jgi:hypothetical protein
VEAKEGFRQVLARPTVSVTAYSGITFVEGSVEADPEADELIHEHLDQHHPGWRREIEGHVSSAQVRSL